MDINYLLIAIIIILLFCVLRGATRGILRIAFGLIAWIFLICFINYGSEFAGNYITNSTGVPQMIQQSIGTHLQERYKSSEEKEAGTGADAVMAVVPEAIKEKMVASVQSSIEATINFVANELTVTAVKGISIILCIILGIIIIYIVDTIIKAVGLVPGVKDVNKLLGILAGFFEGMLIIWLFMYIADCFPTSALGRFIINNVQSDPIITFIYQNNIIKNIIGA